MDVLEIVWMRMAIIEVVWINRKQKMDPYGFLDCGIKICSFS